MGSQKVLFVNTNRMRPPVAPLALEYVGAAIQSVGHRARVLDLCFAADADTATADALAGDRPDLVAVTFRNTDDCYFASRRSFVGVLAADVKRLRQLYDGPVVVGGCGFSLMPVAILEQVGADFGVRGDGEVALVELLRALAGQTRLAKVPGLVYWDGGRWHDNGAAVTNFESFDLSPRGMVDNVRYFQEGGQAGFETKRGCPKKCVYCADPVIKGRQCRLRTPTEIVAEIRQLLARGIDCFHTCDSEFNLPIAHAEAVCEAILAAGLGDRMTWYAYATPAPFTRALAALMRRAGCIGINFGADSGSDAMLAALGRDFDTDCLEQTARICRDHGIVTMFDLLLGGPGETRETLAETLCLMKRLAPDRVGISLGVRVYPGTPLAQHLATEDRQGLRGDETPSGLLFYISPALGDDPESLVRRLIGADSRFFLPGGAGEADYNYNDNRVLEQAIMAGHRGAYWDILRRLQTIPETQRNAANCDRNPCQAESDPAGR